MLSYASVLHGPPGQQIGHLSNTSIMARTVACVLSCASQVVQQLGRSVNGQGGPEGVGGRPQLCQAATDEHDLSPYLDPSVSDDT